VSLLTIRRQDLEFAQSELSALMSLPPGTPLVLADTQEGALPTVVTPEPQLEQMALQYRPELMEEWYRKRVSENDLKIAKAQLWPNIGIDLSTNYDSNDFLYNNYWAAAGVRVSVNLFRLLQLPALNAQQESQTKTDDLRRLALSMAILTQVRVGVLRYRLSLQEVEFADESLRVDTSLLDYARAARKTSFGSELEVIRAEGRYLLSRYEREAAYSDAQAAWGRLFNSIGFDVMPDTIHKDDVRTLAQEIEKTVLMQQKKQWQLDSEEPPAKSQTPDQPASASQIAAPGGGNAPVLQ
jgi:outer membrane protein TolC